MGVSRQPIRFISVDLPEPDGPTTARNSPSRDVEIDVAQSLDLDLAGVVDLADAAHADQTSAREPRVLALLELTSLIAKGLRGIDERRSSGREVGGQQADQPENARRC